MRSDISCPTGTKKDDWDAVVQTVCLTLLSGRCVDFIQDDCCLQVDVRDSLLGLFRSCLRLAGGIPEGGAGADAHGSL